MSSTGKEPSIPDKLANSIKQIDDRVNQIAMVDTALDLIGLSQNGVITIGDAIKLAPIKKQLRGVLDNINKMKWRNVIL